MLTIRLPADIDEQLDKLARKTGRTKIYHARAAILECLDDLEDVHLAEKRYAALVAGKSRTLSLEEVERPLGLSFDKAASRELGKFDRQVARRIILSCEGE